MLSTFPQSIEERSRASPPVPFVEPTVFSRPPHWPVFLSDPLCPTPTALAHAPSRSCRLPTFFERLREALGVSDNWRLRTCLSRPVAPPRPGSVPDYV